MSSLLPFVLWCCQMHLMSDYLDLIFDVFEANLSKCDNVNLHNFDVLDPNLKHYSENITGKMMTEPYRIILIRKVPNEEMSYIDMVKMPGFRVTWNYDRLVEAETKFSNDSTTKLFVRLRSFNCNSDLKISNIIFSRKSNSRDSIVH